MVIFASGTAPPLWSVTTPEMVAVVCAETLGGTSSTSTPAKKKKTTHARKLFFMVRTPLFQQRIIGPISKTDNPLWRSFRPSSLRRRRNLASVGTVPRGVALGTAPLAVAGDGHTA